MAGENPIVEAGRSSRRKGAGRKGRIEKRTSDAPARAVCPGLPGGQFQPLSEADMRKNHHGALELLATTGVGDATQELLDIVLPKGCILNRHGRLCFPVAMMEDIIAGAANGYVVHARGSRAGKDDIYCDGKKVHFSTAGSAVTTFDAETRTYRASTILDVYDFTRLTDRLEYIHMCGDTVIATDLMVNFEHDMNVAYALVAGTEKPLCMSFRSRDFIAPAIQMFDMALGGEGRFVQKPFCIFGGCPIVSPLKFGRENLEVLMEASRLGLAGPLRRPRRPGSWYRWLPRRWPALRLSI
jgi:trimethylamine--corrinoid protein Co-methyltransferase